MRLKFLPIAFLSLLSFKFDPYNTMIANASNTEHNIGKCDEQYTLNTKEYWDCRFKTRDWHNNNGTDQTLHFYTLLINCIPEYILEEIDSKQYQVVDFGCAQGEGTEFFANTVQKAHVTGVDISSEGIEIAKGKNKKAEFLATDLTTYQGKWDVLISSNTLEHFYAPWDILEKLSNKIGKYLIILVPFEQPGIPNHEHFYSFNRQNIPNEINNFKLIYTKIVHPYQRFWGEKQILLIYKNPN
jgi:hypothetical protein